jgi:beta-glucosidase
MMGEIQEEVGESRDRHNLYPHTMDMEILKAAAKSGKLTISFPKAQGQLPVYYSHKPSSHRKYVDGSGEPLFPFDYGLSYSTFEYQNLNIKGTGDRPPMEVSVDITNTNTKDGAEVIQLYVNDKVSGVTTPVKELKGFAGIFLKADETQRVTMTLTSGHFSLINNEMKRVVEPGEFEINIGSSLADIRLSQTIEIK